MTSFSDRRPIAARKSKVIRGLASKLAGVNPNHISFFSMVFAALAALSMYSFGWTWASGAPAYWTLFAAAALIQGRLLCNLLDGLVAVEHGQSEPTGALWNEIPDRPSDVMILAGSGLAIGSLSAGLALACLALFIAYLRAFGASLGAPQVWDGPMAKPGRMHLLSAGLVIAGFGYVYAIPMAMALIAILGLYTAAKRLNFITKEHSNVQ